MRTTGTPRPATGLEALAFALLLAVLLHPSARADGGKDGEKDPGKAAPAAEAVDDRGARNAMKTFEDAVATREPEARLGAVKELARWSHPLIAGRLLKLAVSAEPADLRAEAFRSLARQGEDTDRLARTVSSWLEAEMKESRRAVARGDFGLVMDRKTGDPILDTPEGKAALEAKRARGRMLAAAVSLLREWKHRSAGFREVVIHFLQDGDDGLVAACLGILGEWKDAEALPSLLALHRMYPSLAKWETGAVADYGGTNASAKSKWMAVYGDPDKRRARPAVVKALQAAAGAILGKPCGSPADLEAAMAEAAKGRRRR